MNRQNIKSCNKRTGKHSGYPLHCIPDGAADALGLLLTELVIVSLEVDEKEGNGVGDGDGSVNSTRKGSEALLNG